MCWRQWPPKRWVRDRDACSSSTTGCVCIRSLDADGTVGEELSLEGTIAGRAFATGEPTQQGDGPTVMWCPLSEGSERIGLLELTFDEHTSCADAG